MKGEYLKLDTVKTMAELLNENKELRQEIERLNNIIKEVREYINSIDEIEVRYLNKEALYRNNITEYQIQEQLKKDKTLEGHFVKVNKYYLLEILDKEKNNGNSK